MSENESPTGVIVPVNAFLEAINSGAAFASTDLRTDTITMPGTEDTATVYVRELPDKQLRDILTDPAGYDRARLIAECIRKEDGKTLLTREQASKLKPKMAMVLEEAAMRGQSLSKDEQEKTGNA